MDVTSNLVMTPQFERLQTFLLSPLPNNSNIRSLSNSPMKFSEAGFSRPKGAISDEVECSSCGAKYKGWSGESPLAVHRILNPNCLFLNTPPANGVNNLTSNEHGNHRNELESVRRQHFPLLEESSLRVNNVLDIEQPFLPKQGGYLMLFESLRLLTFKNPFSSDAAMYAKGGFVYNVSTESVFCIFCNVELDFRPTDFSLLETLHLEKFPQCPFIRLYDVGNISWDIERKIRENVRIQHLSDVLENKISISKRNYSIKHPEFEDETSRVGTFSTWPKLQAFVFPAQLMARCGFYYTGFNDRVKCYACGVGLFDWSPDAVPEEQHAKASPDCLFLLQSKGREFIDHSQNIELIVKADHEQSQATEQDAASSVTDSDVSSCPSSSLIAAALSSSLSSPGSPVLDMEAIKAAMACQYTLEQISHAVIKFFVLSSGQYPNKDLLLGTLKAADENYLTLCEKSQKEAAYQQVIQDKDSVIQAKDSIIQAKDSELQVTRSELQRNLCEMHWHELEVRTELEQQFLGQIQQQNEIIQQKDQALEQKDQMIEQHREALEQHREMIEHKDIQLEMKNKELADLQRHIRSLMAELERRQGSCGSDDEESSSSSSDVEHVPESQLSSEEFPVANCKVCLVRPSQIVFLPCKHLCCCDGCASRLHGKNCPICRARNLGFEKVYVI